MSSAPQTNCDTFPGDKKFLTVGEVAGHWSISSRHVIGLIEEGRLAAFDIAGRYYYVRASGAAIKEIGRRLNMPPEAVLTIIRAAKPRFIGTRRAFWRVPVVEGYQVFMRENHSLNLK